MDKKEAYELYIKLSNECAKHSDCYTCPFVSHEDSEEICLLDKVNVLKFVNRVLTLLAEQEQKASVLLGKGGPTISGRDHSNDEQARAINSNVVNTKDFVTMFDTPKENYVTRHDNVNSPKHYCKGGLECLTAIRAQLGKEWFIGYLYGNVIKYMWRWPDKNGLEDLRKAAKYLEWLQEEVKK